MLESCGGSGYEAGERCFATIVRDEAVDESHAVPHAGNGADSHTLVQLSVAPVVAGNSQGKVSFMLFHNMRLAGLLAGALALSAASGFAQTAPKPGPKPATPAAPTAPAAPVPAAPAAPAPAAAAPVAPPPGPAKVELSGKFGDWIKTCGTDQVNKKDICFVTHEFGQEGDQGPIMALAVYEIKGDKERIIRLLLPLGFMIKPGFRFSVDKGAELSGAFDFCLPNGCFTESKVDASAYDTMRKGTILNIAVQNPGGNLVTFTLPLAGMAKAMDGPATDPKVLEEQQKQAVEQQRQQQEKLQQELAKKAEEERKKLEGGAAPAVVPPK